jgi:hypothetical protein
MRFVLMLAALAALCLHADARWRPEFAASDGAVRQWFHDQTIPGSSTRCCDESDGTNAEETDCPGSDVFKCPEGDVGIWVRFHVPETFEDEEGFPGVPARDVDWMRVPDKAIIRGSPNPNGAPIVWWTYTDGGLAIKCFVPGLRS